MFGDYVLLRGGLEPRYRTGETFTENNGTILPGYQSSSQSRINQRGLLLSSQLGACVRHESFGEIGILFGRNITDTYFWSFFLPYLI
jgi:hypothetical protein